jgi:hypothetical protein
MVYCVPSNAGLDSEPKAVEKRLRRLFAALDKEINAFVVHGLILHDIRTLRQKMRDELLIEGWEVGYKSTERLTVKCPKGWFK